MENTTEVFEGLGEFTTITPLEMSTDTRITTTSTTATATEKVCYAWQFPMCDPWVIAAYYFTIYGTYLAYAVGIPGSFCTVVILWRMKPFNSASVWLMIISSIDFLSLLTRVVVHVVLQFNPTSWHPWSCRLFYILTETCEFSTYINLVALTVERFIAVWFPLKLAIWCTVRRAAVGGILVFVLVMTSTMYYAETYIVTRGNCYMQLKYRKFWQDVYQHQIQAIIMIALPMLLVIIFNILIAFRLTRVKKVQQKMSDEKAKEKQKQQNQINRMLMAASIWFILAVSTELVYRLFEPIFGPRFLVPEAIVPDRARIVMSNVGGVFRAYNHAANFILYIIAAKKFRSELVKLITCNKFVGLGERATTVTRMRS